MWSENLLTQCIPIVYGVRQLEINMETATLRNQIEPFSESLEQVGPFNLIPPEVNNKLIASINYQFKMDSL